MKSICSISLVFAVFVFASMVDMGTLASAQTGNGEGTVASAKTADAIGPVDFRAEIFPILESSCFECHSEANVEGDLRLDSAAGMRAGGHTGNVILASAADASELYRRIQSNEVGYRMPKEGPPLSQEQIELFRRWIDQGGKWEDAEPVEPSTESLIEYWGRQLNRFNVAIAKPEFGYIWFLKWPLLTWLLVTLASYGARKHLKKNSFNGPSEATCSRVASGILSGLANFGLLRQFVSLVMLLMLAGLLYQFGVIGELKATSQNLEALGSVKRKSLFVSLDPENLTVPPYPMHLPRLGGTYYRGNDERSPDLFNGGFYRTATFELDLIDERGRRLQIGDEWPTGNVAISLIVNRAPGTTAALFSEHVINSTFLRHFTQSKRHPAATVDSTTEIALVAIEPEQMWQAKVGLGSPEDWSQSQVEGMVYLFYGTQTIDGHKGRVHFGIIYRIENDTGKIAANSELWMGSLYDLGGRVLVPQKGEILLDRWFDFRPIPEIEGENTTDPELLGIPEHLGATQNKSPDRLP